MKLPILDHIRRVDLGVRRPTPAPFVATPYFEAHKFDSMSCPTVSYDRLINYSIGIECHMYVSPEPEGQQNALEIVRRQVSNLVYKDVLRELKFVQRLLITKLRHSYSFEVESALVQIQSMIASIEEATQ
tara:strand:- start:3509 stop:3898 length:390 start_codon:yes stop_codon:yes gene_type:complete